jgi:hypothetical protein
VCDQKTAKSLQKAKASQRLCVFPVSCPSLHSQNQRHQPPPPVPSLAKPNHRRIKDIDTAPQPQTSGFNLMV